MSLLGWVSYSLILMLALSYAGLLLFRPKWTLDASQAIWLTERRWVEETSFFYSAAVLGLVVIGALLTDYLSEWKVRLAIGTGVAVTTGLSLYIDGRRKSIPGISLDLSILALALVFVFLS